MPACELPENPDLGHLKNQAKALQRAVRTGDREALALVGEFHPRLGPLATGGVGVPRFSRAEAQLVVARRYGFASWTLLRGHLDRVAQYDAGRTWRWARGRPTTVTARSTSSCGWPA